MIHDVRWNEHGVSPFRGITNWSPADRITGFGFRQVLMMNTASIHDTTTAQDDTDVLIVGAGPTGLVLALWLAQMGARVRIVDKTAEAGTTSRALAVQARTLE